LPFVRHHSVRPSALAKWWLRDLFCDQSTFMWQFHFRWQSHIKFIVFGISSCYVTVEMLWRECHIKNLDWKMSVLRTSMASIITVTSLSLSRQFRKISEALRIPRMRNLIFPASTDILDESRKVSNVSLFFMWKCVTCWVIVSCFMFHFVSLRQ
jgi:hypothetical protein